MWNDSVVTDGGIQLLSQWAGGGTLTITRAAAGSGTTDVVVLSKMTALTNERQQPEIVGYRTEENGIRYSIRLTAADEEYTANQIGIFARLDGGNETLIAIYQDESGIQIPAKTDMADFIYAFYATIQMSTEGNIEVTVNADAGLTMDDLQMYMAEHTDNAISETSDNLVKNRAIAQALNGKASNYHMHGASQIAPGTMGGKVMANASAAAKYAEAQMRDIVLLPSDPGVGAQVSYANGTVIHVYE